MGPKTENWRRRGLLGSKSRLPLAAPELTEVQRLTLSASGQEVNCGFEKRPSLLFMSGQEILSEPIKMHWPFIPAASVHTSS